MRIARMALSLALLASFSTPVSVQAIAPSISDRAWMVAKAVPLVGLAYSAGRLYWKDPRFDFQARYNVEMLYDIEFAKSHPKEYMKNFWYFYDDGFVGHIFKDKELQAKFREDGSSYLKHSKKRMPMGVLGWTASGLKTQEKAVKFLVALTVAVKLAYGLDMNKFYVYMGLAEKEKKADPVAQLVAQLAEQNKQLAQDNKDIKEMLIKKTANNKKKDDIESDDEDEQ